MNWTGTVEKRTGEDQVPYLVGRITAEDGTVIGPVRGATPVALELELKRQAKNLEAARALVAPKASTDLAFSDAEI